jgi:hypothetical protein
MGSLDVGLPTQFSLPGRLAVGSIVKIAFSRDKRNVARVADPDWPPSAFAGAYVASNAIGQDNYDPNASALRSVPFPVRNRRRIPL